MDGSGDESRRRHARHPFETRPIRVFLGLSLPVFFALIAEPVTALVDTAFVKELGSVPLAAMGVGTVVISSVFWMFNFLGASTQTEVARRIGAGQLEGARSLVSLAGLLAVFFGALMMVAAWTLAESVGLRMDAEGAVLENAVIYLRIRGIGAPAVLLMSVCFGALRGVQDMRNPMWIALGINLINVVLDWMLIFGFGPIAPMGIAGAAWATVLAQWIGALCSLRLMARKIGLTRHLRLSEVHLLLVVGVDLFFRTGLLSLFILLSTKSATRISHDAGAAHQVIRNVWMFAALGLDAFAATAQSLVGYFNGAGRWVAMRHVARVACSSSLWMGIVLLVLMLLATDAVAQLFVPESARVVFRTAWWIAAAAMPLNALAFATDGIHLGTADYRYLRNAMMFSTLVSGACLMGIPAQSESALAWIWSVTALWICLRGFFGIVRIWPGFGVWRRSPA